MLDATQETSRKMSKILLESTPVPPAEVQVIYLPLLHAPSCATTIVAETFSRGPEGTVGQSTAIDFETVDLLMRLSRYFETNDGCVIFVRCTSSLEGHNLVVCHSGNH